MKFMVLMYSDPAETKALTASERDAVFLKHEALHSDLADSGEMLNGAGLAYPEDTTTIRWQKGTATAADGPLTDVEEQLTAYYVLECESAERARAIAERVLDFHVTAVEVRQVHDSFGMTG